MCAATRAAGGGARLRSFQASSLALGGFFASSPSPAGAAGAGLALLRRVHCRVPYAAARA